MKVRLFPLLFLLCACTGPEVSSGVSAALARYRKAHISGVEYTLSFRIPDTLGAPCAGEALLSFDLDRRRSVQLDFRPGAPALSALRVNGTEVLLPETLCRQEHIVLPGRLLRKGPNMVSAAFTPTDATMNRHEDYLYTLLVPALARTLFPCFDQPDLKARFSLSLDIPEEWVAVSNAPAAEESVSSGRKRVRFSPSGLLPTYLFSFTAGRWQTETFSRGGAPMTVYYRETDPAKVAQLPEIQRQIVYALDWMEDFTAIPMPFEKYDYVLVPGFQFGGMEHPGAILYRAERVFLGEAPTDEERFSRTDLLSHETAHLWFGDAVTMEWFGDVWTKEVFANHFAAMIARPLFPDVDHRLRDFRTFNLPAYDEDRTAGATPIRQRLDNLEDAGLIYSNIVYDKAPVVMRMLADTLGPDGFRAGLREYLQAHLYGNATWPDLISALDRHTPADLAAWSRRWVETPGLPVHPESDSLANLSALGYGFYPLSPRGLDISCRAVLGLPRNDGAGTSVASCPSSPACAAMASRPSSPACAATASCPSSMACAAMASRPTVCPAPPDSPLLEPSARLSTLANLFENMVDGRLAPGTLLGVLDTLLRREPNPLVASAALKYLSYIAALPESATSSTPSPSAAPAAAADPLATALPESATSSTPSPSAAPATAADPSATSQPEPAIVVPADSGDIKECVERILAGLVRSPDIPQQTRLGAFRMLAHRFRDPQTGEELYGIWKSRQPYPGLTLSETDYTSLALELARRRPQEAAEIHRIQRDRIPQPDRRKRFDFVFPATSASQAVRDSVFQALLEPAGRLTEPWAEEALALLNHPLRDRESLSYILPGLDELQEVQRTGDIFFPKAWLSALLSGHACPEAAALVRDWLTAHPDYPPLLKSKLLQVADPLLRF